MKVARVSSCTETKNRAYDQCQKPSRPMPTKKADWIHKVFTLRADATWLRQSIAPVVRFAVQFAVWCAYLPGVHLLVAGAQLLRFCCNSG